MFSSKPANGLIMALCLTVAWGATVVETQVKRPPPTTSDTTAGVMVHALPAGTPQARNIASALQQLASRMRRDGLTATNVRLRHPETYSTPLVRVDTFGRLHTVMLVTTFDAQAEAALASEHVQIETVDRAARVIQVWIPFDRLENVAMLPFVRYLRTPSYARRR